MRDGYIHDAGQRAFATARAGRWSASAQRPSQPLRESDAEEDEIIRLRSGNYVFKKDLHPRNRPWLSGVPIYSMQGHRLVLAGTARLGQEPETGLVRGYFSSLLGVGLIGLVGSVLGLFAGGVLVGLGHSLATRIIPLKTTK